MDNFDPRNLPFTTRQMLDFDFGTAFDLEVSLITYNSSDIFITGMTKAGAFTYKVTPEGNSAIEQFILPVNDVPISVTVHTGDSNYDTGDLYIRVWLRANSTRLSLLTTGYLSNLNALAWPMVHTENDTGDKQNINRALMAGPGPGADLSYTVPANYLMEIDAISIDLTTSATVANRRMHIQVLNVSGVVIYDFMPLIDQAASLTYTYLVGAYTAVPDELDNNYVHIAMPRELRIKAGESIRTLITNLQAGDQVGDGTVRYKQYWKI